MIGSKTPGQNNAASDEFLKKQAEAQGLSAPNVPAHKEGHLPGERSASTACPSTRKWTAQGIA
ncbi:hypothetical protein F5Y19DRAFT_470670 [Xylariaceae sp. FL1651]|nr:hypothetical protein F5Y19DRAFT_470670 [Xylariaceae sp. FL1651]